VGPADEGGSTDAPAGQAVSLQRCLQLAESNYPKIAEARARMHQAEAQLREAGFARIGSFSSTAGIGLAPTVRGTDVYSRDTDESITDNMGLGWQVRVGGTVPLWTFGKITGTEEAAGAQVKLKGLEVQQAKNELRASVRQAYYGAQFATVALSLVRDAVTRIEKELNRLAREVEEEDADEVPLYKMRMYRSELTARESEASRQRAIALASLRFLTGAGGTLQVPETALPEPKHGLAPLSLYQSAAKLYRPELAMARAGMQAREAQLRVEAAKYFPDLGLSVSFDWSRAPEVTDQKNPFVYDPANYRRFGIGLGLKWNLDFLPQLARYDQAEAKLEEVRATERYAQGGIAVEVEKAYWEAVDAEKRLAAFGEAAQYARRWMVTVQQGRDIGAYDDDEIVDAAKEYALKRFSEMNAAYDYTIALSRLAVATGWEAVATVR
jgi:outer membrane protein TolC